MDGVRFVAAPRSVVAAAVGEGVGFRILAERMFGAAKAAAPVGESEDRPGGALRDALEYRVIGGADPRILIGARGEQGTILGYVTDGTDPHPIDPKNAKALRFTSGGTVVFAPHVDHPGTNPNDFILRACRAVAHDQAMSVA